MDDSWIGKIIRYWGPFVAGWATFAMVAVHYWRARNERRRDDVAEKAASWSQMEGLLKNLVAEVERLGKRLKAVEAENEECRQNLALVREELATERAERMKMEAQLLGIGMGRQQIAEVEAAKRLNMPKDGET